MSARAVVRRVAHRIPGIFEWQMKRAMQLRPWAFTAGGRAFEAMIPGDWLREIENDDGTGRLTGFDRDGRYEAAFSDMFLSKLSASTLLLDVGANYGLYSVMAAQSCSSARIFSFEPDRAARWILEVNNARYCRSQLNVVPRAVGSREKRDTTTLDAYCERNALEPTLVKMDIEGAELLAVGGMRQICTTYRPVILFEFHLRKLRDVWRLDPLEVLSMLRDYGYRLRFNGHHDHLVRNRGRADLGWHDTLPNEVNCAVLAEPE